MSLSFEDAYARLSSPEVTTEEVEQIAAAFPQLWSEIRRHRMASARLVAWINAQQRTSDARPRTAVDPRTGAAGNGASRQQAPGPEAAATGASRPLAPGPEVAEGSSEPGPDEIPQGRVALVAPVPVRASELLGKTDERHARYFSTSAQGGAGGDRIGPPPSGRPLPGVPPVRRVGGRNLRSVAKTQVPVPLALLLGVLIVGSSVWAGWGLWTALSDGSAADVQASAVTPAPRVATPTTDDQVRTDLAAVAQALDAYRTQHGQYPKKIGKPKAGAVTVGDQPVTLGAPGATVRLKLVDTPKAADAAGKGSYCLRATADGATQTWVYASYAGGQQDEGVETCPKVG